MKHVASPIDTGSESLQLPKKQVARTPLSWAAYAIAMQKSLIDGFDEDSFSKPITQRRLPGLTITLVCSHSGIKHVGVDNAKNYIKSPITLPIVAGALGEGLVTSEGQLWKDHRKLMSPSFDTKSIAAYAPLVTSAVGRSTSRIDKYIKEGVQFSLKNEMMALALDIISHSMFSSDATKYGHIFDEASRNYQDAMGFSPAVAIPYLRHFWYLVKQKKTRNILYHLNSMIFELIEQRSMTENQTPPDLLDRLLSARDEDGIGLDRNIIRDQMVTIFVAGHETTALALMWSLLLLTTNPSSLAKSREEVDRVVGTNEITYADCQNLTYIKKVFYEALRLYPPVHSMAWRTPLHDDIIDGVHVQAGSIVAVIPWVVHRHSLHWENPSAYDPERFEDSAIKSRPRYAYIPFGVGPRTCIGASFSMMEGLMCLAGIIRQFDFDILNLNELEPNGLITLHPMRDPIVKAKYTRRQ